MVLQQSMRSTADRRNCAVKCIASYIGDMASRAVFIVAAKRTPFGTFGGKLKCVSATELCRVVASSALEAGQVPAEHVDSVIIGNVAQVGTEDYANMYYKVSEISGLVVKM